MADKKISQLTSATTPLDGTEVLPIVQSNSTVKVSAANITVGRAVQAASLDLNGGSSQGGFTVSGSVAGIRASSTVIDQGDGARYLSLGPNVSTVATIKLVAASSDASLYKYVLTTDANANIIAAEGNLKVGTAGKGIDFSANTHAAGMTGELLNDYEEGTWTPNQGAGLTVNGTFSSDGTYTKVGRLVSIHGRIGASVSLSASGALCSNLPYSPASNSTGTYLTGAAAAAGVLWAGGSAIYTVSPGISSTTDVWFCLTYQI